MITFKDFLQEKIITTWSSENISRDDALIFLNENCRDGLKAVKDGGLLFRGFSKAQGFTSILDSSDLKRTSLDTNNVYQLMMDSSSKLKDYPKRSNSFICSTYFYDAADYGSYVYAMIPVDGTKIASGIVRDFLHTLISSKIFDKKVSVKDFTYIMGNAFKRLGIDPKGSKFTNIGTIDSALGKLQSEIAVDRIVGAVRAASDKIIDINTKALRNVLEAAPPNKRATHLASEIMSPESLSLSLNPFGDKLNSKCEAWFSGKCVAIEIHMFKWILQEMAGKGFPIHANYDDIMSL